MQLTRRRPRVTIVPAFSVSPSQIHSSSGASLCTHRARFSFSSSQSPTLGENQNHLNNYSSISHTQFLQPFSSAISHGLRSSQSTSSAPPPSRSGGTPCVILCEQVNLVINQQQQQQKQKQKQKQKQGDAVATSHASSGFIISSDSSPSALAGESVTRGKQSRASSVTDISKAERNTKLASSTKERTHESKIDHSTLDADALDSMTEAGNTTKDGSKAYSPSRVNRSQTSSSREMKEFEPFAKNSRKSYTGYRANTTQDYNVAISFLRGTAKERAQFISQLRKGEQKLSVNQFNDIVSMLSRERRINDALAVVEIAESESPLANEIARAKSVKSYTIMIDVYGKAFQLSKAFALFYSMNRNGAHPNIITYNAMIASCARCSEPDLAYEVFEEMKMNGLKPDKFTYGSLVDSCAKCGQVDRAFEISAMMDSCGVQKDETVYSALMEACGRTEQLERALTVFEEMKRKGVWPNQVTFAVLIDTCANVKQPERAFHLFSELKHWGYPTANVIVFTALIDTCAKSGWPERAELVMDSMLSNGVEPNQITFGALMEGWARQGRLDRAFEVLDRMVNKHTVSPNAVLIGGLTDACRKLRESWRVSKLWDYIVRFNLRPSKIFYPSLIVMALMEEDIRLATAIILHAYARGCLRRAALNSEDPALQAIACALVYFRHEVLSRGKKASREPAAARGKEGETGGGGGGNKKNGVAAYAMAAKRMSTVFKSTGMSEREMDQMSATEARNRCLTWGDAGTKDMQSVNRHRASGIRRDRKGVHRKEGWSSLAAAKRAKDLAAVGDRQARSFN